MLIRLLLLFSFLSLFSSLQANALKPDQVPEPLKPWVDWVLYDETERHCPYLYNDESQACAWPSKLELHLNDQGGTFTQSWQVFGEKALVRLAGDQTYWPQQVQSEQGALVVQSQAGQPHVQLSKGIHTITGTFVWNKLPKALYVTPEVGLLQLTIHGKPIAQSLFNQQGRLWLTQGKSEALSEDNLDIQVFRKIKDSHPIEVTTSIKLRVSGKQRNVTLNPVLLDGFIPTAINSRLPARMEGKQQLQVQLRAGEWTIEVIGRAKGDATNFTMPVVKAPWSNQEVWVFEADNNMRQVEVQGVNSIDPNQTQLPNKWKNLPAYLLSPEQTLELLVLHRGAAKVKRDELRLEREMWLDYDGAGYTIKDQISGHAQISRLNMAQDFQLGRVRIDEKPQFITQDEQGLSGVEIRQRDINLGAESRFETGVSTLPVSGWEHDLQQVNTTLHLPPGWQLFSASDTDNLPKSWIQAWSLLDIFLVLIIALAIGYLYNWKWSVLALVTLVLVWHENDAPRFIWLNLLAATALLKVLPTGRLKRSISYYRWASLLALAIILLPYTINTIRIGLYPQLNSYVVDSSPHAGMANMVAPEPVMEQAEIAMDEEMLMSEAKSVRKSMENYAQQRQMLSAPAPRARPVSKKKVDLQAIDPNSMIQTGFGLPQWQSNQQIRLRWHGPIKADETSRLILISPFVNMMLKFLGILLLLLLTWRFVSQTERLTTSPKQWFKAAPLALACFLVPALLSMSSQVQAESMPNEAMLEQLQTRLLAPPECLPECAQIEQMQLAVKNNNLHVRLRVHASTDTAIPLLGRQDAWLPSHIWLNDEAATAIQRDEKQQLWLAIPKGLNDILLSGVLPSRHTVSLPLPLKPHAVRWQATEDWTLDGIKDNGTVASQLQLNRISKNEESALEQEQSILPTFVKVKRQLNLGLDWYVETTVTRISPQNVPLSLSIPLLPNEQPLSDQLSIKNQKIRLNLNAQQNTISWSSRLKPSDKLVLTAASHTDYVETWQVDSSPVWHVEATGLPVNQYHNNGSHTVPVWFPWGGESLTLAVSRPKGVAGQTVTILDSQTEIQPGKRANDVTLTLDILSSRGVQHPIQLPENAEVQAVSIDGVAQRIQRQEQTLTLTLKPKRQTVVVSWREPEALGTYYQFPAIDLSLPSANAAFDVNVSHERWVLWVDGPMQGPAILFWGILLALLLLAVVLGRSKLTPLKTWQWFLLGIGLSQTETTLMILVIAWLFALALREKMTISLKYWQFNLFQVALVGLTLLSLLVLMGAVANGLLGRPDMQIAGNGSSSYMLSWYQDRVTEQLPQPSVISVSLWWYRALMLVWALWLAIAVLSWLRWGWKAINVGGLWRSKPKVVKPNVAKEE